MKGNLIVVVRKERYDFALILGVPTIYYHLLTANQLEANFFLLVPDDKYSDYLCIFDRRLVYPFSKEKELYNVIENLPTIVTFNDIHFKPDSRMFANKGRSLKYVVTDKKELEESLFIAMLARTDLPHLKENYSCVLLENEFDLLYMRNWLRRMINCNHVKNGVRFTDIDSAHIGPLVKIESGAVIQNNVSILGKSYIGKDTVIDDDCKIVDSNIASGNLISKSVITRSEIGIKNTVLSSYIEDSVLAGNNEVGPFAHLRNQTILEDNTVIGNFVEIKGTRVNDNVKIKHHTYIGDTLVEKNVNIGCGVITANYDGVHKHRTHIGENSFIGCDTTLVAPVKIGKGSYIAAGSTITQDVGSGDLAIARSRQVIKKGYIAAKALKKA